MGATSTIDARKPVPSTAPLISSSKIRLDRHQHDLDLFVGAAAHQLVIPNHFVDGKGNVLLRFKRNDSFDLFFVNSRQLYKPGKNRLSGHGIVHPAGLEVKFIQNLAQNRSDLRITHPLSRRVSQDIAQAIVLQDQTAVREGAKFAHPNRLRTEVKTDDTRGGGHDLEIQRPACLICS